MKNRIVTFICKSLLLASVSITIASVANSFLPICSSTNTATVSDTLGDRTPETENDEF